MFPKSSKKTARAINAASGSRPLVVLANLSGFDGSAESLRNTQLEYGAEIGRAIVNFDGPIIFCVVSRYHGGAFVVFAGALNDNMEVIAVEGSFASVIGGAPAAAVVFTRDVNTRTANDQRIRELESAIGNATSDAERGELRARLGELRGTVRSEKLGEVAAEFEQIHNIERAREVGSVHTIIPADQLRPYLIKAVERGMAKAGGAAGRSSGTCRHQVTLVNSKPRRWYMVRAGSFPSVTHNPTEGAPWLMARSTTAEWCSEVSPRGSTPSAPRSGWRQPLPLSVSGTHQGQRSGSFRPRGASVVAWP